MSSKSPRQLLESITSIIQGELSKIETKAKENETLDIKDGKLICDYAKALLAMSKDDRESSKAIDFSNMGTDELENLLQEHLEDYLQENGEQDVTD